MSGERDRQENESASRAGWVRPLGMAALVLVVPLVAYVLGYVWWGRELYAVIPPAQPEWRRALDEKLYELWTPPREWEARRARERLARLANGVWETANGRRVKMDLDAGGRGWIWSEDFPILEYEGAWFALVGKRSGGIHIVSSSGPASARFLSGEHFSISEEGVLTFSWLGGEGGAQFRRVEEWEKMAAEPDSAEDE